MEIVLMSMPIVVEVSLRIPNIKNRSLDENGYPIDHSTMRFTKLIDVPSIPKPGVALELTTSSGQALACEVTRADWHEERAMFVLSCRYSRRSMPQDEYSALVNDAEWRMKPLL
jgi:hypothetical protein